MATQKLTEDILHAVFAAAHFIHPQNAPKNVTQQPNAPCVPAITRPIIKAALSTKNYNVVKHQPQKVTSCMIILNIM
jgi:hypothetical protein